MGLLIKNTMSMNDEIPNANDAMNDRSINSNELV